MTVNSSFLVWTFLTGLLSLKAESSQKLRYPLCSVQVTYCLVAVFFVVVLFDGETHRGLGLQQRAGTQRPLGPYA